MNNYVVEINYNYKIKSVEVIVKNTRIKFDFMLLDIVKCSKCNKEFPSSFLKHKKENLDECCKKSDKINIISNYYPYRQGYGIRDELSKRIVLNKTKENVISRAALKEIMYWYIKKFRIDLLDIDYFVPVPGTKNKPNKEFYPQMNEIAIFLAEKFNLPILLHVFSKEHEKKFKLDNDSKFIKNKNILLLDDVYNDGDTFNDCHDKLREAGAKSMNLLVFGKNMP